MDIEEPLLKLNREYTDKELVGYLRNKCKEQEKRLFNLTNENKNLKKKDGEFAPYTTSRGNEVVSIKAYNRLNKRHSEIQMRFWEVVKELNELKNSNNCEKL